MDVCPELILYFFFFLFYPAVYMAVFLVKIFLNFFFEKRERDRVKNHDA